MRNSPPPTNANADGDDTVGTDDEDSVTLPTIYPGNVASFNFNVTNVTSAPAYLSVWIDFNNNGLLTETGEQVLANVSIPSNTTNANQVVSFTVPPGALAGSLGVRIRLCSVSNPGPTGTTGLGEVEDYKINSIKLGIGDLVYEDKNNNGQYDAGTDAPVQGAVVSVYSDANNNGIDAADAQVGASVTTPATGLYSLTNLTPGKYFVKVTPPSGNVWGVSTSILTTDPGAGGVNNKNYAALNALDAGAFFSPVLALSAGGEPAAAIDGDDTNTNSLMDFALVKSTYDFGDLADLTSGTAAGDYQTLLANNGPRHIVVTGLKLGAAIDPEANGLPTANADGDGSDDDGVATLPTLTLGFTSTFNVTATNTTGTAAKVSAWIDWNNNGNFEEATEKVASDVNVPTGTNNGTIAIPNFSVPGTAYTGGAVGMRIRLSNTTGLTSLGAAASGEVEDYKVAVNLPTLVISPPTLPMGTVGVSYNQTLSVTGGVAPYTWTITSGSLPAGLTFNAGLISGIPTASGSSTFVVTAKDTYNSPGTKSYTINIANVLADWGDLPSPKYATLAASNGPSHNLTSGGLRLGAYVDPDSNGQPNATADGDDALSAKEFADFTFYNGSGSSIPWMTLSNFTVSTSTNNGSAVYGSSVDQFAVGASSFINSPSYTAAYGNLWRGLSIYEERLWTQTVTSTFTFPAAVPAGWDMLIHNVDLNEAATIRAYDASNTLIPMTSAFAAPTFMDGQTPEGDVVQPAWNSATSKLTSSFSGSSNTSIVSFKAIASTIKRIEIDYYLPGGSTAGNYQGGSIAFVAPAVDDEDGITFPTLTAGSTATIPFTITNPAGQAGKLNAWIDWNNDGDFLDAGEQIATNTTAAASGSLSVAIPLSAVSGNSHRSTLPSQHHQRTCLHWQCPRTARLKTTWSQCSQPCPLEIWFGMTRTSTDCLTEEKSASAGSRFNCIPPLIRWLEIWTTSFSPARRQTRAAFIPSPICCLENL